MKIYINDEEEKTRRNYINEDDITNKKQKKNSLYANSCCFYYCIFYNFSGSSELIFSENTISFHSLYWNETELKIIREIVLFKWNTEIDRWKESERIFILSQEFHRILNIISGMKSLGFDTFYQKQKQLINENRCLIFVRTETIRFL